MHTHIIIYTVFPPIVYAVTIFRTRNKRENKTKAITGNAMQVLTSYCEPALRREISGAASAATLPGLRQCMKESSFPSTATLIVTIAILMSHVAKSYSACAGMRKQFKSDRY